MRSGAVFSGRSASHMVRREASAKTYACVQIVVAGTKRQPHHEPFEGAGARLGHFRPLQANHLQNVVTRAAAATPRFQLRPDSCRTMFAIALGIADRRIGVPNRASHGGTDMREVGGLFCAVYCLRLCRLRAISSQPAPHVYRQALDAGRNVPNNGAPVAGERCCPLGKSISVPRSTAPVAVASACSRQSLITNECVGVSYGSNRGSQHGRSCRRSIPGSTDEPSIATPRCLSDPCA